MQPVGLRRDHWNHAQMEHQLPRFITFVSAIHQHRKTIRHRSQLFQQGPSVGRIVIVAERQSEDYCRSSIRGNHMNFCVPSASALSNRLWSFFLKSACSIRMNLHCSGVDRECFDVYARDLLQLFKHPSNTPFLAHRFIRI